jgi:hypothetical protein
VCQRRGRCYHVMHPRRSCQTMIIGILPAPTMPR